VIAGVRFRGSVSTSCSSLRAVERTYYRHGDRSPVDGDATLTDAHVADNVGRVALDVTALYSGGTGVARYVREVAHALIESGQELELFAIGRGDAASARDMPVRRLRVPLRVVHRAWRTVGVPRAEWVAHRCVLLHAPDLVPAPTRLPVVMTVHDLDAVDRPELHHPRAVAIQRAQLEAARNRAAIVITSAATAPALRANGLDADRIVVTTYGVTPLPEPDFGLVPPQPYLLAVGALDLRKGQDVLVSAFGRAGMEGTLLVLAGPNGFGAERVISEIERQGLGERVIVTGRVTDAQLAGLYERCLAVCVPSRAEGFGIPILEAASLGAPVVASDITATRALEGAVSAFAPVDDSAGWADVLEATLADHEHLAAEARERGPAFARQFTWERVAAVTRSAYRRALEAD
jgi:glycosyltransferase involved in cell wall biosynthesis